MSTSALLDETNVKVVYDQQGNKREVLLSYEKYAMLVELVKRYTRIDRQALPQVQENATSQIGWEIFNALGRDAQPGVLPDAAAKHDTYLYGKAV